MRHNACGCVYFCACSQVTMPALRGRLSEHLSVPVEELQSKEVKAMLLEAFQKHLTGVLEAEVKADQRKTPAKGAHEFFASDDEEMVVEEAGAALGKTKQPKVCRKPKGKAEGPHKPAGKKAPLGTEAGQERAPVDGQIDRLKSYIVKCGVRKVWYGRGLFAGGIDLLRRKKELDGLSKRQSLERLQALLGELGMEGRPTLEKCKEIKKRREFEAEMREMDMGNIIRGPRLRGSADEGARKRRAIVPSEDEDEDGDEAESDRDSVLEDLKALGDAEEDD